VCKERCATPTFINVAKASGVGWSRISAMACLISSMPSAPVLSSSHVLNRALIYVRVFVILCVIFIYL